MSILPFILFRENIEIFCYLLLKQSLISLPNRKLIKKKNPVFTYNLISSLLRLFSENVLNLVSRQADTLGNFQEELEIKELCEYFGF